MCDDTRKYQVTPKPMTNLELIEKIREYIKSYQQKVEYVDFTQYPDGEWRHEQAEGMAIYMEPFEAFIQGLETECKKGGGE